MKPVNDLALIPCILCADSENVGAVPDEFGNSTERQYTAWPDRIYLIDGNGRVAYKSKPGPFGFKSEELKAALVRVVH